MMKRLILVAGLTCAALPAMAQQGASLASKPASPVGLQAPILPAEVQADRSIKFRFSAPSATEVGVSITLRGPTEEKHAMVKDADGIWSATAGPLEPDTYQYSFVLGGAKVNTGSVEVSGTAPLPWEMQDVPHGFVVTHSYFSKVQNRRRNLVAYLPPDYFSSGARRYPVLYLFSGMGEEDWTKLGHANLIFDNFIAQHKAVPAIIVMPNNTTGPVPVPALENAAIMEREVTTEIIPMIAQTYRTVEDREHRAIAGLSFGGGTAFMVGMRHLDTFAYVSEFGTGAFGGAEHTSYAPGYSDYDPNKVSPTLYQDLRAPATAPKLFFMSVGDGDPRAPFQKKALAEFQKNGINPIFKTFPGGHEMRVFRDSLIEVVPLLFQAHAAKTTK